MGEIIAMLVCIGLNGVLSLTEMAFVSVGKNRLRGLARTGNQNAQRLIELRNNPERTLSILQIGITLLGAVAAAIGGVTIEEALSPYLEGRFGSSESVSEVIGIIFIVIPLTYLSVVAGELVPKTLALRDPLRIALKSAKWLMLADRALTPIVNILEWSTKKLLRLVAPRSEPAPSGSEGDSVELDHLSEPHRQYVLNLVNMESKRIRDIFVPIKDVVSVSMQDTDEHIYDVFIESGYTRLPVFQEGRVVGILHSKEFMALFLAANESALKALKWIEIIRPVPEVQPHETPLRALRLLQENKTQMAVVRQRDEILGVVTLEDILEEIIGDVFDEDEDGAIKRIMSTGSTLRAPRGDV